MRDTIISRGGAVKALPNGHVEGYLVVFGSPEMHDLSAERDYFTPDTDFGLEDGMKSAVYYAHALDPTLKNRRLTNVSMKVDDVGVWVEGQIKARDDYEKALLKMAEDGKLGWSSGTASHLVTRKAVKTDAGTVHEILSWPLGLDASLTPTPAEPRAAAAYTLKSLAAMITDDAPPATKSRADFTYDDLRALLEQEWNEDFGGGVTGALWAGSGCDSWEQQWHIVAIKDDFCVGQQGWDGELIRRTYTITAGNDVTWGEPAEVARTTAFVAVTEGDDAADAMKTAPTDSALDSALTFADHLDTVLAAVAGVIERAEDIQSYRIKAGRAISAANRDKMKRIHQGMQVAHAAMAEHMGRMDALLTETDPDAKKSADEVGALRTQHLLLQSRWIGIA